MLALSNAVCVFSQSDAVYWLHLTNSHLNKILKSPREQGKFNDHHQHETLGGEFTL